MRSQGEYLVSAQTASEVLSVVLVAMQIYQINEDMKRDAEIRKCREVMQKMKDTVDSRQF